MRFLKKFFQRLGRKNKKPAKPVCVVVYAVDHVRHRFVYKNIKEAEKNYQNLANVVVYSAESCKIDEGIVTMFVDGILHHQASFTPYTGLQVIRDGMVVRSERKKSLTDEYKEAIALFKQQIKEGKTYNQASARVKLTYSKLQMVEDALIEIYINEHMLLEDNLDKLADDTIVDEAEEEIDNGTN